MSKWLLAQFYTSFQKEFSRLVIICFLCDLQGGINLLVDYVVYRGKHCSGCVMTFSYGGVKINGATAHGDEGTFGFEAGIDDIVSIESQNLQRVSFSYLMGI
jgi:hypothetical protein